ncbi:Hypothetical predicted protein [Paramuricea clavata]|uniref:Uncharacterized protein n=1 Tax=Paramuricea clavata TaxID=317549 RepID=A0A6S7HYX0_PARCT|nr:Hypothetical predicted protein [Paramuricea clavata]
MPSFYIYLIDGNLYHDGERVIKIGIIHWLLGIYAEIEITFTVYPERYDESVIFLPSVTAEQFGYKFEYQEFGLLPHRDTLLFVNKIVDGVIDYIKGKGDKSYNVYDRSQIQSDIHLYCKEMGVLLSEQLFQVLIYNHLLVKTINDFVKSEYCIDKDCSFMCYCNHITDEQ